LATGPSVAVEQREIAENDSLMFPLAVIMCDELYNGGPQRILSEQNHPFQARLLNTADEPLGVAVQVR